MKKICIMVAAALLIMNSLALAESIQGKVGITARGGFAIPADSKFTTGAGLPAGSPTKIEADTAWAIGGGVIYGITENVAAELDVSYSQFDQKFQDLKIAESKTTDISIGLQYRFMPKSKLVPYIGAGLDVLINDSKPAGVLLGGGALDVDTTFGGHINAGADFFITKNIAFNAEFKGRLSTEGDVKESSTGIVGAKADPSNFSGMFGLRFFIN